MDSQYGDEMVARFHQAFGYETPDKPCIPGLNAKSKGELRVAASYLRMVMSAIRQCLEVSDDKPMCLQRAALETEELAEFLEAMANNDMENVLKELTDRQFVLAGSVRALGLAPVFPEAMRRLDISNMSKVNPDGSVTKDSRGKAVKGPNYQPAELGDLVK